MKAILPATLLAAILATPFAKSAPDSEEAAADTSPYTHREPGPGGIGKIYMGREISRVMGHQGINWLERDARADQEKPAKAVEALDLEPDARVADIGAGSGYYTFRIARLVPEGEVVAVDIQPEMIAFLKERAGERGVDNVEPHLGEIDDVGLPAGSLDLALMVDAYHEFSHPREMMESIVDALRPGGRVILLEYRAEDPEVPIKPLHKMTAAQAREEMSAVGLDFVANHDFLPWQHFLVFEKSRRD